MGTNSNVLVEGIVQIQLAWELLVEGACPTAFMGTRSSPESVVDKVLRLFSIHISSGPKVEEVYSTFSVQGRRWWKGLRSYINPSYPGPFPFSEQVSRKEDA